VLPYLVIVPVCAGLAIKLLDIRVMQLITAVGAPLLATLIMSLFIHLLSPLLGSQSVIARLLTLCVSGALIYGLCVIVLARDTVMFGVKFLRQRRSRG